MSAKLWIEGETGEGGGAAVILSDKAVRIGGDRRELARWLVEQRRVEDYSPFKHLAEMLTPVFQFLADGYATGNLEIRAWVILYAIRPDLLGGETMKEFADLRGVHHYAIQDVLKKFQRELPHLSLDLSTRGYENGNMQHRRELLSEAMQRRQDEIRKRIRDLRQRGQNAKKSHAVRAAKKAAQEIGIA